MLIEKMSSVNWLAVLVAGVAMFFVSGVWYGAIFQKMWHRLSGYSPEALQRVRVKTPPPVFFAIMAVCYIVIAAMMGIVATTLDIRTVGSGATLGVLFGVAMSAALLTGYPPTERHRGLFLIEAGFLMLATPVAGVILALWH